MASLVDQIFLQAQLGTAPDPNANPFLEGVKVRQNQQRINLAKQELAANLGFMAVRQTLMQQEARVNERALDEYMQAGASFATLREAVSEDVTQGNYESAWRKHLRAGLDNNVLLTDPRYKVLGEQIESMKKEASMAEYKLLQAEATATRAEAYANRAALEGANLDIRQQRLMLDQETAARKQAEFELRKQTILGRLSPEQRLLLSKQLEAIDSDITLIGSPDEKLRRMEALAAQAGVTLGTGAPAAAAPVTPAPGVKVGRFTVRPK